MRPARADGDGLSADVEEIRDDHVVIASGSVPRLPPVPGLAERGWELKGLGDVVALRDRAVQPGIHGRGRALSGARD